VTMMVPMVRRSLGGFEQWAFGIAPSRPDHHGRTVILGEAHLRQVLKAYNRYYNATRTHL
jgi:hypothetical protein